MIYADATDTSINGWLLTYADTKGGGSDGNSPDGKPDSPYMGPPNKDGTDADESTEAVSDSKAVDTVSYEKSETGVGASGTPITLGAATTIGTTTITISNVENLIGTDEDDFLKGDSRDNVINGLDGADNLNGGDGADNEVKGDTVSYKDSDRGVTVNLATSMASGGHAQGDTISNSENATGSAHSDTLTGNTGANVLKGLADDDELEGGTGGDTLEGGAGADELNGGTHADDLASKTDDGADRDGDTVSYAGSDAGVTVSLASISFSGGHAEGDEDDGAERDAYDPDGSTGPMDPVDVSSFENVTGSDHNDSLTGDHRDNTLMGGKGDDTLRGGASSTADDNIADRVDALGDVLIGGPGADMLDGGEDANEKNDKVGDADASIDVASYAGAGAGVTVNLASGRGTGGDAEGDTLVNIEQVWGSDHDDTFLAGSGNDHIDGGKNTAAAEGGVGDTVSYELSPEAIVLTFAANAGSAFSAITADAKDADEDQDSYSIGDKLKNIENVTGTDYGDTITGGAGNNVLMGRGGGDTLNGGGGDDTLDGGDGKDTLKGGDGADTLKGGAGVDMLEGGGGKDTLNGGAGRDELTGNTGKDTFVFSPADGNAHDIINDFSTSGDDRDRIDLSAFGLDAGDLVPLIETRGTTDTTRRVQIDLTSVGGGTIELANVRDLDLLDIEADNEDNDIDTLSVARDYNGDGDYDDTLSEVDDNKDYNGDGDKTDTGLTEDGMFIL